MIEKIFGDYICDSCGEQTPVSFIIYNPAGFRINTVDLCRKCSNKFAEDVIDSLRKKVSKNLEVIENQANVKRSLKKKITQMNRKSHNHKVVITNLYKGIKYGQKKRQQEFKSAEPWKEYGLTRDAYYNRLCKGIPLEQAPRKGRGRKVSEEELREYQLEIGQKEYRRILTYVCNRSARIRDNDLRASRKHYENTPEKLEAIKEKYRNGVTGDIMKEFESKLAATENPFCP